MTLQTCHRRWALRRFVLSVAATVLVAAAWAPASTAAEADPEGSLLTSPSRALASVPPGATTTIQVTVQNLLGRPTTVTISTADLAPARDGYSRIVDAGDAERGAGEWLVPAKRTLTLLDGQRKDVEVTVAVPEDADAGGHYGAVVVEQEQDGSGAVGIRVRLVTNVTVVVPGDVRYDAEVRDLEVPGWTRDEVPVRFRVHNTGGIHVRPVATIEVRGPRGARSRERVELREILPGGSRSVRRTLDVPALAGRHDVRVRLRLEDRSRSRVETARFVGLQTRALLAAAGVVGLLVLLAGAFWLRRWLEVRRYLREELESYDGDVDG